MELPVERLDEDKVLLVCKLDERAGFVRVRGKWLFEQDVLSGLQGFFRPSWTRACLTQYVHIQRTQTTHFRACR